MRQPLPFDAFLEVLRAKGYGVSLHEHMALAKLLERWDRTNLTELRDALAALIGRSEDEVQGIGRLFDELCQDALAHAAVAPAEPETERPPRIPWRWVVAAASGLLLIVAFVTVPLPEVSPPTLPAPPSIFASMAAPPAPSLADVPAGSPPPVARRPTVANEVAAPPPPALPPVPQSVVRAAAAGVAGAGFLLALAAAWYAKARRVTGRWLREAWQSALAALPGPFQPSLVIRGVVWKLPRFQVEDAAVILGRIFGTDARAHELDVAESIRLTLKRGLLPHLAFKRVRTARPIVVLEDVSYDMSLWREKVRAFLGDLARQGIVLERWYFEGDPRRLSDRPRGTPTPLMTVMARRPDSPLLIIGTGAGLEAVLADADVAWLRSLKERVRKAWITPLVDARAWPDSLQQVPVPVWPMTRLGLTGAARALAGFDVSPVVRGRVLAEGRVTQDDIERVKRLASLVPHPTMELLEYLRQRFAADIPDAAIAHLFKEAQSEGLPVLRMSPEEIARCVDATRRETPRLEAAVRREILAVLDGSAPPEGSAAHLRWQLARALQDTALARVEGRDAAAPTAVLQTLGSGPLWEEVAAAIALDPGLSVKGSPSQAAASPKSVAPARRRSVPPKFSGRLAELVPKPKTWPGAPELVPAAVSAVLLCAGAWIADALPTRTAAHVDAYRLTYEPATPVATPQFSLRLTDPGAPRSVNLYRDGQVVRSGLDVPSEGGLTIDVPAGGDGSHYQVRAGLPAGNLAISNSVWVPPANRLVVLIDAQPWARVTIDGEGTHLVAGPTPVSVPLAPGTYQLQLENGGLTSPRNEAIIVAPGNQEFRFVMPGFDPNQAADTLLGAQAK